MAEDVAKIVLDVVKKECSNSTCSYKAGDSQKLQDRLTDRLMQKLKHRLADGNEVRVLEKRVELLEKTLRACLRGSSAGIALHPEVVSEIKKALTKKS